MVIQITVNSESTDYIVIIGGLVTILTFFLALKEYRRFNKIKRAEFLETLIKEFHDQKTFLARKILDDFWIVSFGSNAMPDEELIFKGSKSQINDLSGKIKCLLRFHKDKPFTPFGYGEQRARQSFDDLLDFFGKLEYYRKLGLIEKEEISYFEYYLKCAAKKHNGVVLEYATNYGFDSFLKLLFVMGLNSH